MKKRIKKKIKKRILKCVLNTDTQNPFFILDSYKYIL